MSNQIEDIKDAIVARLEVILPSGYQALAYQEDVFQNNWNQVPLGYGVRALEAAEVSGVNKVYTLSQTYEVILTERYLQSQVGDEKLREKSYDLREQGLVVYKDMVNNKAGLPGSVMNVSNLFIAEPEIDVESKVVVQRIEFIILHRISLI